MAPLKLLKTAEAAVLLRLSVFQVAALCRTGKLRARRPGGQWLISEADLQAYVEGGTSRQEAS